MAGLGGGIGIEVASPGSQVNLTEQRSIYAGGNELQPDGEAASPEPVQGGGGGSLAPTMGSTRIFRWSRGNWREDDQKGRSHPRVKRGNKMAVVFA